MFLSILCLRDHGVSLTLKRKLGNEIQPGDIWALDETAAINMMLGESSEENEYRGVWVLPMFRDPGLTNLDIRWINTKSTYFVVSL